MTPEKVAQYKRDGYAVFQEVFDKETIDTMKEKMSGIVKDIDLSSKDATKIAIFSTENSNKQLREDYFLDSAWQIKPFFESDAIGPDG